MPRRMTATSLALMVLGSLLNGARPAIASPRARFVTHGPWGGYVSDVEVDPVDGRVVFAVVGGIQRSTNGGRSWNTAADAFPVVDLAIAPSDPQVIYTGG